MPSSRCELFCLLRSERAAVFQLVLPSLVTSLGGEGVFSELFPAQLYQHTPHLSGTCCSGKSRWGCGPSPVCPALGDIRGRAGKAL